MVAVGGEGEGGGGVAPELPPFPVAPVAASADSGGGGRGEGVVGGGKSGEPGAGRGRGVAGAGAETARWRKFTPLAVNPNRCLGRTWDKGKGGQCNSKPTAGADLCGVHAGKVGTDQWLGKVTGEIPEQKLSSRSRARRARRARWRGRGLQTRCRGRPVEALARAAWSRRLRGPANKGRAPQAERRVGEGSSNDCGGQALQLRAQGLQLRA